MTTKTYIANRVASTIESLPRQQREQVTHLIDSLEGDGWKAAQPLDGSDAGQEGLRIASAGDMFLLFTRNPEQGTIIVTEVSTIMPSALDSGPTTLAQDVARPNLVAAGK